MANSFSSTVKNFRPNQIIHKSGSSKSKTLGQRNKASYVSRPDLISVRFKRRCFRCGKDNHIARQCSFLSRCIRCDQYGDNCVCSSNGSNKSIIDSERKKALFVEKGAVNSNDTKKALVLNSGMVLLKNFISPQVQMEIVNKCYDLGVDKGGFYRPGFKNGAKLKLYMMCMGKSWNPQSKQYEDRRECDGALPPEIPIEFKKLVSEIIEEAKKDIVLKGGRSEELPHIVPDICIANYYNQDGNLGMHQDKDENEESIKAGIPVVSVSIGDSAEFIYKDVKGDGSIRKLLLESRDVLIFGGKSRDLFHGISGIIKIPLRSLLLNRQL